MPVGSEEVDQVQQKLNKILETRYDTDREITESLKTLSTFFTDNTLDGRRNLQSKIELRSLELNKEFLAEFREIKLSLDSLEEDVNFMNKSVARMRETLESTQSQTHTLINQTNDLQSERKKLQIHQNVATAFLDHFQLSKSDHDILYGQSRDEKITSEFFTVLDNVQSIHNECRVLIQNGFDRVAFDIMEQMALHQEAGLERLYRFTQSNCRIISDSSPTELTDIITKAMSRLQIRPVLFKYVIDEFSTNRRSVLVKAFIEALTVGENGNKSIEFHVHDSKRYIADIFTWLHQALASERETLLLLLKDCEKNDLTDIIDGALSNIADGITHPLKVRIDSVFNNMINDVITLYSIANLIRFYHNIIRGMVRTGILNEFLKETEKMSENFYLNSLNAKVREVLNQQDLQQSDMLLMPPLSVKRLLAMLKELLNVANMVEGRRQDIAKIVNDVIDPLILDVVNKMTHLSTCDMAVYYLNVLYEIIVTLSVYEFIDMERLNASVDAQLETLTSEQASSIVANLNLGPIYTVLQSKDSEEKLDVHHLKMCMKKLDAFIECPDILKLPQVNLLQSTNHAKNIQNRSVAIIVAIYKQLYEKIHSGDYQNPDQLLKKTPEEVQKLLIHD